MTVRNDFQHVTYLWDDETAAALDPVGRLVYRSNLLGQDQRITNTGGGNTSSKYMETDPLTGAAVEVLWVKGSGGDLRTSKRENFSSLYMDKIRQLQNIYDAADEKGVKTPIEDEMVGKYLHCVYNLNPRASSIDTPLHAFIPAPIVDHTHPNAVIAIAAAKDGEALTAEIFGDELGWVDWQRPGFDLGLVMGEMAATNPALTGLMMGGHGLINWAGDDKTCYELSLEIIEKAARYIESRDKGERTFGGQKYATLAVADREALLVELLPALRGMICERNTTCIGTVQADEPILRFVNSHDAARLAELGTSCPDHFLRTKIKPLYVDWDPQTKDTEALLAKLESGLTHYRQDYAAYYNAHKRPDSPAMRDPNPTVFLIPGVGMITWGKNKSESRVHRRILHLRGGGDARSGNGVPIHGPAQTGGLRYRILAAGGGEAAPHAAGTGVGPQRRRRHRRRQRHRQGYRPPRGEGRRACRLRRPERGRGARHRRRTDGYLRCRHRRGRRRHLRVRSGHRAGRGCGRAGQRAGALPADAAGLWRHRQTW